MAGIHAAQVDAGVVAVGHLRRADERLVHPERVVGVEVGGEDTRAEAVSEFGREDALVERVGVGHVARGALQECAAREEGRAADVSEVGEYVVLVGDVVVGAALDRVSEEVHVVRLGVFGIVVEAVVAPVSGVGDRTRDECVELVARPLELCEYALLVDVSVVVAVDLVAHLQLLVLPRGIGSGDVVRGLDVAAAVVVDEVLAVVEVDDLVVVLTDVVADIDTGRELERRGDLVGVGREQTVPHVVVVALRHHHARAVDAGGVELLDLVVGERAVGVAERGVQDTVVRALPGVAVGRRAALSRVSRAASDRHVEGCRERRLVVDLPLVVERDLGLVVLVEARVALLAVLVETVAGVVAVHVLLAHEVLGLLPLGDRQTVVQGVALSVLLGGAECRERELVPVVDALRDVHEPVVALEVRALDVAVAPALGREDRHGPSVLGQAGREAEREVVESVVADAERERAALLGVDAVGDDVHRTAHRGGRDLRGAQTALRLHAARHVRETGPVRPVDAAPFHVIDRYAVHHHGDVGRLEAAHVDLGVTEAAAVLGHIYAGGRFEDLGELLSAEFVGDLVGRDGRYGHRGLALHGHRLRDDDVLQRHGVGLQDDCAEVNATPPP